MKKINFIALIICLLFYLTCYLRFIGQLLLGTIQLISAFIITFRIYSEQKNNTIKNKMKIYWLITLINITILLSFFKMIMWNDFLQLIFVTIIPNITAIYFYKILISYENTL